MEYNQKHFAKTEKHFSLFGIIVKVEDEPLNDISVKSAVSKALSLLPDHLRKNVNNIFIGDFDRLKKRDFEAMYENGNIFLVNTHHNEDDMVDDIVHEFAHSVEEQFNDEIYGDGSIRSEFYSKRLKLYNRINKNIESNLGKKYFTNLNFDKTFDKFLHDYIGYDSLRTITSDLFYSPYGSTSIREYFANGFEAFFMRQEVSKLKKVSPSLFKILEKLLTLEEKPTL
jgi:hypothetical protein